MGRGLFHTDSRGARRVGGLPAADGDQQGGDDGECRGGRDQQRAGQHQGGGAVEGADGDAELDGQDRESVGGVLVLAAGAEDG
jgi:hypothetical protein